MPGCVLRVVGSKLDPHAALRGTSLVPYEVFVVGQRQFPDSNRKFNVWDTSGFQCEVSSVDGELKAQVDDAIDFLRKHQDELRDLTGGNAVDHAVLDFGYDCRLNESTCIVQCDMLPAELLRRAGELGIDIELSLYPAPHGLE